MRSSHRRKSFEELAIERDRELERAAAEAAGPSRSAGASPSASAPEGADLSQFKYDFSTPLPGTLVAREAAAYPLGAGAAQGDGYASLVERLLSRVWHTLYTLGEQRQEIVRLRENTRQVLARLSAG